MYDRDATLQAIRERRRFPVVIIGAGINGAGLFRDLALQGVDCLLIDRGDFGGGTSAAPSRLIHGGLKYLETGEFDLVAESARERNRLLRNAPHYVKPLPSVVPVHSRFGGTLGAALHFLRLSTRGFERGGLVLRLGLALYDWLGRHDRVMPRYRYLGREQALQTLPDLREDIVGLGCYYDARVTYAERLTLELVLDGLAANPRCAALNYAAAVDRDTSALIVEDGETGERLAVEPEIAVNAGGPWIDHVNGALRSRTRYVGGSKGSHLVLDHPELRRELDSRMVYFGASDGRICLAYPFFDHVLVGSTDIPVDDPDAVICDDTEIDYMLAEVGKLFPTLRIAQEQVVYHYVGVRPLPAVDADDPGKVPRSHSVQVDEPKDDRAFPVLSLIGGKWTTFRNFAEEVADDVLQRLRRQRQCPTHNEPIGGGRDYPTDPTATDALAEQISRRTELPTEDTKRLLERYGTRAEAVAKAIQADGAQRLTTQPTYFRGEIQFLCQAEAVCRLTDILLRRTALALTGNADPATVAEIADIAAEHCHWTETRRHHEIEAATLSVNVTPDSSRRGTCVISGH